MDRSWQTQTRLSSSPRRRGPSVVAFPSSPGRRGPSGGAGKTTGFPPPRERRLSCSKPSSPRRRGPSVVAFPSSPRRRGPSVVRTRGKVFLRLHSCEPAQRHTVRRGDVISGAARLATQGGLRCRIYGTLWRQDACLVRAARLRRKRHPPRKAIEEVESRMEDPPYRREKSLLV